jgi:ABC-type multidrug transport system fused ATPase/permease subunit
MGSFFSHQNQYQTIPDHPEPAEESASLADIFTILQSYFWPDSGSDSAFVNRLRSTMTWVMVVLSKGCNIISPLYLSYGTDNLVNHQVSQAVWNILIYCLLRFLSFTFKGPPIPILISHISIAEFQSIIYLKVKQQANIQLAHRAFSHIHQLSLNWHLNKKMGNIMRIMDRGTSAADTLVGKPSMLPSPLMCCTAR